MTEVLLGIGGAVSWVGFILFWVLCVEKWIDSRQR